MGGECRRLGPNVVRNLIDRCDYKHVSAIERKKKRTPFPAWELWTVWSAVNKSVRIILWLVTFVGETELNNCYWRHSWHSSNPKIRFLINNHIEHIAHLHTILHKVLMLTWKPQLSFIMTLYYSGTRKWYLFYWLHQDWLDCVLIRPVLLNDSSRAATVASCPIFCLHSTNIWYTCSRERYGYFFLMSRISCLVNPSSRAKGTQSFSPIFAAVSTSSSLGISDWLSCLDLIIQ